MKHRRRLLVAALGVGVALTAACTPQAEPPVRVVLITLDTLRLDSFLGSADRPGQMPRLRKWAERGRVFELYYSSTSTTQPTHATLLTGLHPWEHGVPRNGKVKARIAEGSDPARILAKARGLYDGDVSYLDGALDRVLVQLDEDREEIETHVLVVSDHGESFGEGGSVGHGRRLTTEQIRVPCFGLSPRVAPGVSVRPIGTTDLTTTILSLAGVAGEAPGGRDLVDRETEPARVVGMRRAFDRITHERRIDGSVHVLEGLRFYVLDGQDLVTGNGQGAVTLNDSSEELADPERAASARQLFAEFEEQFMAVTLRSRDDEETLKKLEALGYVR